MAQREIKIKPQISLAVCEAIWTKQCNDLRSDGWIILNLCEPYQTNKGWLAKIEIAGDVELIEKTWLLRDQLAEEQERRKQAVQALDNLAIDIEL